MGKFDNVTMNKTESFALTFKSTLNETYTTTPIVMKTGGGIGSTHDIAKSMESALLALPNGVIDGVSVNMSTGAAVQGPQNKLIVETASCGDGCTPKLGGVDVYSEVKSSTPSQAYPLMSVEETT